MYICKSKGLKEGKVIKKASVQKTIKKSKRVIYTYIIIIIIDYINYYFI